MKVGPWKRLDIRELMLSNLVLEKTVESPLDSKEIKPVNPKGNQPWIFIGRTYPEAPILWPLTWRINSLEKTLMLGKNEGKRRGQQKLTWLDSIIDSMDMNLIRLEDSGGQRQLACCSPWESQRLGQDLVTDQQQWDMLQELVSRS